MNPKQESFNSDHGRYLIYDPDLLDERDRIQALPGFFNMIAIEESVVMLEIVIPRIPKPISGNPMETKPPLPPFTLETAKAKVQAAEDAWNTRDPERVSLAYTEDSVWRNRAEFFTGREKIREFLTRKWNHEFDYRLKKELWSFTDNRISVKFEYEYHTDSGQWYRAYGNEQWEFAANGLMQRREASINDLPIQESERKFRWERNS